MIGKRLSIMESDFPVTPMCSSKSLPLAPIDRRAGNDPAGAFAHSVKDHLLVRVVLRLGRNDSNPNLRAFPSPVGVPRLRRGVNYSDNFAEVRPGVEADGQGQQQEDV